MKILVSDPIAEEGLKKLRECAEVDVFTDQTKEELIGRIGAYDALIVRSQTKVTAEVIKAAKNLKVIGRAGVGVDNVDLEAATRRGVLVVNSPDANTIAAAEHTIALMMSLSRNIPQANAHLREGQWKRSKFMGIEVYNKTLGIIGLGRIGSEVAKRAKGLGMRILAYDPYVSAEKSKKLGAESVELEELLRSSDFITLHVPLTSETHHMISQKEFELMKEGVRIINCARGGLIDEGALYEFLKSGKVAGAALDVFEKEPPTDSPLLQLDNVITTPHLGASTLEAQVMVALDIAAQVSDVLQGRQPHSPVNLPAVSSEMFALLQPYILLAERIGKFQAQIAEGKIKSLEIIYRGQITELETEPITRGLLKGFLEPFMEGTVNFINAPFIIQEMDIRVTESKSHPPADYTNLIALITEDAEGKKTISGTLFGKKDMRIVGIDDFRIEVTPEGYILVIWCLDKPGIIGRVGTILGKNNINIAGMQYGREEIGGKAIMALNVDSLISQETLGKILELEAIDRAKLVQF